MWLRELPWKGLRAGLERVAARVAVDALKNRWLGRGAARVAVERPAGGFGGFEGGQTAGLNALKMRWLGRVAARVAVERPAEGLEGLRAQQA